MSIKAYKYRLEVNKMTSDKLHWVIERARELYNAALAERKEAWRMSGKSISYYEQKRDLVELKESIRPEYQDISSHILQDVMLRVERAYQSFFRRVKNVEKPGYPRFKGCNWYDSFTYPDPQGWKLTVEEQKMRGEKHKKCKATLHLSEDWDGQGHCASSDRRHHQDADHQARRGTLV